MRVAKNIQYKTDTGEEKTATIAYEIHDDGQTWATIDGQSFDGCHEWDGETNMDQAIDDLQVFVSGNLIDSGCEIISVS